MLSILVCRRTDAILLQGPSEGGLYPIHLTNSSTNKICSYAGFLGVKTTLSTNWYNRLGHTCTQTVARLVINSLLLVHMFQLAYVSEPCQLAEIKQLVFVDSVRDSHCPLELVRSDVWTSPILSISGSKYYVVFINKYYVV
jgi:hypothetical protein